MYSLTEAIINNAVIHILIPVHWARVLLGMRAWLGHSLQSCVRAAMLTALLVLKHLESLHLPSLLHSSHHRISEILHLKGHSHVFVHSFIQQLFTEHLLWTNKPKQTCAAVSSPLFLISWVIVPIVIQHLSTGCVTCDPCRALLWKTCKPLRFNEMPANTEHAHWLLRGQRGGRPRSGWARIWSGRQGRGVWGNNVDKGSATKLWYAGATVCDARQSKQNALGANASLSLNKWAGNGWKRDLYLGKRGTFQPFSCHFLNRNG